MEIPTFYRIDAARFLREMLNFRSDKERGRFIKQFALDLVTSSSANEYTNEVIKEAIDYISKKKNAGSKGGKKKASNAKASLKQCYDSATSKTLAISLHKEKEEKEKPYLEIIEDLNRKGGYKYKVNNSIKENINGRISEGFSKEDFFTVHSNMIARWKDDPEMCQYLRPDTLYRPSKFQGYLNAKPPQSKCTTPEAY